MISELKVNHQLSLCYFPVASIICLDFVPYLLVRASEHELACLLGHFRHHIILLVLLDRLLLHARVEIGATDVVVVHEFDIVRISLRVQLLHEVHRIVSCAQALVFQVIVQLELLHDHLVDVECALCLFTESKINVLVQFLWRRLFVVVLLNRR